MTLPNLISVARLLTAPVLIFTLSHSAFGAAFLLFVLAGLSDAADGAIARRFSLRSSLGAYLDPIADKALLGSVFVGLGLLGRLPDWLVVAVVSRDLLIVAAVLLSSVMGRPVTVKPILVSKATTLCQIVLAAAALAEPALSVDLRLAIEALTAVTALLTLLSAATYLTGWLRHMAAAERTERPSNPAGAGRKQDIMSDLR